MNRYITTQEARDKAGKVYRKAQEGLQRCREEDAARNACQNCLDLESLNAELLAACRAAHYAIESEQDGASDILMAALVKAEDQV